MYQSQNFVSVANSTDVKVNVFFATFLPLLSLATIVLNSMTILAFWKLDKLREKPSELLILNLSCADFLTGLFVIPLWSPVYITPKHWPMGEIGCRMAISALNMAIHGSLFALLSISIDRFMLISMDYPRYVHTQTKRTIKFIIATCWCIAVATVAIEMGFWNRAMRMNKDAATIDFNQYCLSPPRRLSRFSLSFFFTLYLIPVIAVCTLSIAFLYRLHQRLQDGEKRRLRSPSSPPSQMSEISSGSESNQVSLIPARQIHSRYVKPAVTLVALVLAMTICMLPYCLYVIITDIKFICPTCQNVKLLYNLLLLQFCNACLDPFLYAITKGKIRNFYSKLFRSIYRKIQRTY